MNRKIDLGRKHKKITLGNDALNTKKEIWVLCSDKIKTSDVTCLPLDVSDHTGTAYMHWNDYLAHDTEMIQYLSTVAGKAPFSSWALHLGSLSILLYIGFVLLRCYESHIETSLNMCNF